MASHAGEEGQERPPGVDADDPDVHEGPARRAADAAR